MPFNGSVGGPCRGQEDGGPGQIVLQNHYNFVSASVFVIVLVFVFVFVIVFVLFHPWHWMATSSFSRNLLESVCGHVNSVQHNVVVGTPVFVFVVSCGGLVNLVLH